MPLTYLVAIFAVALVAVFAVMRWRRSRGERRTVAGTYDGPPDKCWMCGKSPTNFLPYECEDCRIDNAW